MTFAEVSIQRPVFTIVVSLLILLFGAVSVTRLGVREYPSVDPPTISITTNYPGAAAEIVSFAPVAGPGGAPSYVICAALGRANDDGAARATAVERAQAQLAEVARALEWLMRESRAAAQIDEAGRDATLLAHDAVRDAGTGHG